MDTVLLEAFSRGKVDISSNFADLYQSPDIATFIDLVLELVRPTLLHTLLDGGGVVEGPAFNSVCLSHLFTSVAALLFCSLSSIAAATIHKTQEIFGNMNVPLYDLASLSLSHYVHAYIILSVYMEHSTGRTIHFKADISRV